MSNAPRILTTNYSSVQRFLLLQYNDFLPKSNWSFDLYRTYLGFPEHSKLQVHHFRHWVGMNLSLYQIKRTAIKIPESSSPIQDGANKPGAGRRPIIYNLFGRNLRFLKLLLPRSTLSIMWVLSALIPAGTVVSVTSIESTLTTSRNNCFISVFTCICSPGRMLILERLIITLPAHDKKKKKKLI